MPERWPTMDRTMKPILLTGYMGCGKSTLGRKLARRLGVPFFDTDTLVEEHEGAAVADIFRFEGEERFRTLEREALLGILAQGACCVVSTGAACLRGATTPRCSTPRATRSTCAARRSRSRGG